MRPAPRALPDEQLQALVSRRRQVVEMLTAERNRLRQSKPPVQAQITRHITWLQEELATLDKDLSGHIHNSQLLPALREGGRGEGRGADALRMHSGCPQTELHPSRRSGVSGVI